MSEHNGDLYKMSEGVGEILNIHGFSMGQQHPCGAWLNQRTHAKCSIDILTHKFPMMDREAQKRASATILRLQALYGLGDFAGTNPKEIRNKRLAMGILRAAR